MLKILKNLKTVFLTNFLYNLIVNHDDENLLKNLNFSHMPENLHPYFFARDLI